MKADKIPLFISIVLFCVIIFCNSKSTLDCGVLVKSTCNDKETTTWNRKNISQNLKEWIRSLIRIREMTDTVSKNFFLRKKLRKDYASQRVTYISNMNCLNKTSIRPIWKTPGNLDTLNRKLQFDNGFLYGIEDKDGKLTGRNNLFFLHNELRSSLKIY